MGELHATDETDDDGMITVHAPATSDEPVKSSEAGTRTESLRLFFLVLLVFSLLVIVWLINNMLGFAVDTGI